MSFRAASCVNGTFTKHVTHNRERLLTSPRLQSGGILRWVTFSFNGQTTNRFDQVLSYCKILQNINGIYFEYTLYKKKRA